MTPGQLLLVDDDTRFTRLVSRVAERIGFLVTIVNDPLEFEGVYRSLKPGLIILDLNMPGKDGIELLDFLAADHCRARLVFISGADKRVLGTVGQLASTRGLDFAGVMEKPIEISGLRQLLQDQAKRHGMPTVEDLDHALESGQIDVAYQGKIDLGSRKVVGAEALARWTHPVLGPINPEAFVGVAEITGRIDRLTNVVMAKAMKAAADWGAICPGIHLAVNLSPQLLSDSTLPDRFADAMKQSNFDPGRLQLEVTERGVMEDAGQAMAILSRLRLKRIGLSIDDFGTGSSSLVQLYRLPFGEIKIDKSFVMEMLENHEAEVIVNSIIQLGKNMDLNVVAEGVENESTLQKLQAMRCDHAQGYHIARPLPDDEFLIWLSDNVQQVA